LTDLDEFKLQCDLIVANRREESLADIEDKLFSRDLFGSD
jgi:UDPglucose 6-dehydrogenase